MLVVIIKEMTNGNFNIDHIYHVGSKAFVRIYGPGLHSIGLDLFGIFHGFRHYIYHFWRSVFSGIKNIDVAINSSYVYFQSFLLELKTMTFGTV